MRRTRKAPARLGDSAAVFFALGDETRLRLLVRLSDAGPMSVAGLTEGFSMSRQAITKHLRVMNDAGLISSESRGRETVWTLEEQGLAEAQKYLQTISRDWDAKLRRLKALVED